MMALAPNLTVLVGDLVGARLISKAGSLTNLAKHPASTLQILGAEKALFRALKSNKNTPKYGLIYHSQLVGQSSNKNKGKISRMLAAKASLASRVDALGESSSCDLGVDHKAKLEMRLKQLEEGNIRRISGTARAKARFEKYHSRNDYMQYSASADSTLPNKKPLIEEIDTKQSEEATKQNEEATKQSESKKKKKKKHSISDQQENNKGEEIKAESGTLPKKKKKHSIEPKMEDTAEAVQDEVQIKVDPDTISKKKKKRSTEPKMEAIAGPSTMQEVVRIKTEPDIVSKKKKKHSLESKEMETLDTSPKKRKRLAEELKTEEGESSSIPEAQTETDSDLVQKKKKKKRKHESQPESAESEEAAYVKADTTLEVDVSVGAVPETSEGQKKKKKKKRDKEGEEVQEMSVSVEEVEETVPSEKKKKKKKLKCD